MKTILKVSLFLLISIRLSAQSNCNPIPEVNFPGGRVIMTFDGNVHDDDDIVGMPYSAAMWWAAGLKNKVVQIEYNNHVCDTNTNENDESGPGAGDDSQNMRTSASGIISRFGYNASIFYDYETKANASTNKMAAEIEKSTASNPLWIIAAGPMETLWRAMEKAKKGHKHLTVISHSNWNEKHAHCSGAHTWSDIKNKYLSKGVYFVGFCKRLECSGPSMLKDQNAGFSSEISYWTWMKNSSKEYNRWIFKRNPFSNKFDPSDAGMSYFLITGGPFNGGDSEGNHNDAKKLLENPCTNTSGKGGNTPPSLTILSPTEGEVVTVGSDVSVDISATDAEGSISTYRVIVDGVLKQTSSGSYTPYTISNIKAGSHTIKVKVTDNSGAVTVQTIGIIAQNTGTSGNQAPSLSISAPQDGQNLEVGASLTVMLDADDEDGKIKQHQISVNGVLKDTDGSTYSPYKMNSLKKGSYAIKATVTDNKGAKTSETISFTVGETNGSSGGANTPPSLSITAPANGATVVAGTNVAVKLLATDEDGKIVIHRIFLNGVLVDKDGQSYSTHRIKGIKAGNYTIKAKVTDDSGAVTTKSISFSAVGNSKQSTVVTKAAADFGPVEKAPDPGTGSFLTVAPNPVKDGQLKFEQEGNQYLYIVDMQGALIKQLEVNGSSHEEDISELSPGLYFIVTDKLSKRVLIE